MIPTDNGQEEGSMGSYPYCVPRHQIGPASARPDIAKMTNIRTRSRARLKDSILPGNSEEMRGTGRSAERRPARAEHAESYARPSRDAARRKPEPPSGEVWKPRQCRDSAPSGMTSLRCRLALSERRLPVLDKGPSRPKNHGMTPSRPVATILHLIADHATT